MRSCSGSTRRGARCDLRLAEREFAPRTEHALPLRSTACYDRLMSEAITQRELRNSSGEIMRRLDEGESFVVTRNGVPVGELTPLRRLRFVPAASITEIFRTAPAVDAEQFRSDLDAFVDQDAAPRA